MSDSKKKLLAESLKNKLNSPEYIAMPDLITYSDRCADMLTWIWSKRDWKENWISGPDINPGKGNKKESENLVYGSELEKEDFDEIVNLIEKRNHEKRQIWETKFKNIEQKLNQQSNLYYYWGKARKNERADVWIEDKGMRGFCTFLGGNGNGLTHHLYIAENHPVLDSFAFQTGFYLIDNDKVVKKNVGHYEGGFGCSGGETNPNNWQKYVEASDQITITPHEITDKPVEKPSKNDNPSGNNHLGGKANNYSQPTKKLFDSEAEKEITNWLVQYFQENNIKEINLKNGELEIVNNNNKEVKSHSQITNTPELKNIQNWLERNNQQHLDRQSLNIANAPQNSLSQTEKKDYTPYLAGGAIGILITAIVVIAYFLGKRKSKKNI